MFTNKETNEDKYLKEFKWSGSLWRKDWESKERIVRPNKRLRDMLCGQEFVIRGNNVTKG